MARPRLKDRVGPGTPAWLAFDAACDAWKAYVANDQSSGNHNPDYKRYWNRRSYMIRCLRQAGAPQHEIDHWCHFLQTQRNLEP